MPRLLILLACLLLCACGQKGPLYLPDEGTALPRLSVPGQSGPDAAPANDVNAPANDAATPTPDAETPAPPTTPDRTNEPRKRIHTP